MPGSLLNIFIDATHGRQLCYVLLYVCLLYLHLGLMLSSEGIFEAWCGNSPSLLESAFEPWGTDLSQLSSQKTDF